jgi:uncharacterized protein YndB with AHSA1/START domain
MPAQKIFKQRVRARMNKTGESYTAARHQLLRKATERAAIAPAESAEVTETAAAAEPGGDAQPTPPAEYAVSTDAMVRASGRSHEDWFALLDAWDATERPHAEVARWLRETHGVAGWWAQSITVDYERARGIRARHQMSGGFTVSANRTVAVNAARLLEAFTEASLREQWLPDATMQQRPTRAALTARFDWSDPPSRVVVIVLPKGEGKATVNLTHEQLPDAETAERLKGAWRAWLGNLKSFLERA